MCQVPGSHYTRRRICLRPCSPRADALRVSCRSAWDGDAISVSAVQDSAWIVLPLEQRKAQIWGLGKARAEIPTAWIDRQR